MYKKTEYSLYCHNDNHDIINQVQIVIGSFLDESLFHKSRISALDLTAQSTLMVLRFGSVLLEHSEGSLAHWVVDDRVHFASAVCRFLEVDLQQVLQVVLLHHNRDACQQHRLGAGHVTRLRAESQKRQDLLTLMD